MPSERDKQTLDWDSLSCFFASAISLSENDSLIFGPGKKQRHQNYSVNYSKSRKIVIWKVNDCLKDDYIHEKTNQERCHPS